MNERRKNQRFQIGNSCIVNHDDQVGTIVDICRGGLSCMCLESNRCNKDGIHDLDIFCIKDNLLAEGLKVKKLGSEIILGKYLKNIKTRKCRLQFVQLHEEQANMIETIILAQTLH